MERRRVVHEHPQGLAVVPVDGVEFGRRVVPAELALADQGSGAEWGGQIVDPTEHQFDPPAGLRAGFSPGGVHGRNGRRLAIREPVPVDAERDLLVVEEFAEQTEGECPFGGRQGLQFRCFAPAALVRGRDG